MKRVAFPVAFAATILMLSPAFAHAHGSKPAQARAHGSKQTHAHTHGHMQMACSTDHLSKMTAMMGTMPDGSNKWMMNGHLAMLNAAMAKDGTQGCEMAMMDMMHGSGMHGSGMKMMKGSKMPMMKSGM